MIGDAEGGNLGRGISSELESITLEKVAKEGFENARKNHDFIADGKDIMELSDGPLAKGDVALVIAAGPSLHRYRTAEIIRKSEFGGVLVSTESSMPWCLRNDIIPDLVVTVDSHPRRIVRWFGDPDLTEEALKEDDYYARQDLDPKIRQDLIRFNEQVIDLIDRHGPTIRLAVSSSASSSVVDRARQSGMDMYWWNPMYDDEDKQGGLTQKIHQMNGLACLNAGGNVGTACWVIAHSVLGKKRVGLVGMDFGYYADTPYTQTQYYKEILDLVGPDRLDEMFIRITNPHLDSEFYTDPAYLWYRDAFLQMAGWTDCETHNCTGGGILFGPGIRWTPLSDFLQPTDAARPKLKEAVRNR